MASEEVRVLRTAWGMLQALVEASYYILLSRTKVQQQHLVTGQGRTVKGEGMEQKQTSLNVALKKTKW